MPSATVPTSSEQAVGSSASAPVTGSTTPTTLPLASVSSPTPETTGPEPSIEPLVATGADVLVSSGFSALEGRRVGLIAHQNSVVGDVHLADHLADATNLDLVALFGPEHGIRGDRDAGEYVEDSTDPQTGVPVFSLFGETRQPTPEMLDGLDVLVYDLQDVGTRFYTYISTMGLAMQAAAAMDIDFVVLDRPNPLGGEVAGGVLEPAATSFVGLYPIADTYGLTAGELAHAIVANRWLEGLETLQLSVLEMTGWHASMRWADTGLPWIAPSPALTSSDSALVYPATVYLESASLSYGRGTDRPFMSFGAPWLDAPAIAAELTAQNLAGLSFTATRATPQMLPGMTVEPAFLGLEIPMVTIDVTDHSLVQPVRAGIHILAVLSVEAEATGELFLARPEWLDQLSGSTALRDHLERGDSAEAIIELQRTEVVSLEKELEKHHLYARSG